MDKGASTEQRALRAWCESSNFSMCEATDIFDALCEISDFTLGDRPDVVVLGVDSCEDGLPLVRQMADVDGGHAITILALSPEASKRKSQAGDWYYRGDLAQVTTRLSSMMP
jgi:hypothetical protein